MPTFKYGGISALTLSERITTPSLCLSKNGQTWYVPLFSGNKGSVVKSGKYNYTLGGFNIGNYKVAISRSLANKDPSVTVVYEGNWVKDSRTLEAIVTNLQINLNDPDGDLMSLKVYCGKIIGTSMNYTEIVSLSKTNQQNGYINLPRFTIQHAGGYSGVNYALRFDVYDSKGAYSYTNLFIRRDIPNTDVLLNGKLFWFDDRTMYRGYYSDDYGTIYITGHRGSGTPYFQIGGFDKSLVGKTVTWKFIQNEVDITSRVTESSRNINNSPTITEWGGIMINIDGARVGGPVNTGTGTSGRSNLYGIKCFEGWMPNGIYDLVLTIDSTKFLVHLNMNDPGGREL